MGGFFKTLATLTAVILAWLLAGCAGDDLSLPQAERMKRGGPLVVGMDGDHPPFTFENDKGELVGIEVDFARALEKELGRKVIIRKLPWHALRLRLLDGTVDVVMSGVSITKKRAETVLFTRPYMEVSQMALMRVGAFMPNPGSQGAGMRLAYLRYTTGEMLVERLFAKAQQYPVESIERGIALLLNGTVDYLFADSPTIWFYLSVHPLDHVAAWTVPYTREKIAWAVAPSDAELKERLDAVVDKWLANGFVSRVVRRWIPVTGATATGREPLSFER
ncbi:substrate-binding periplasmic protein [Hydrogenimonas sp.]